MENNQFGNTQQQSTQPNQPMYRSDEGSQGVSLPPPQFTQAEPKGMFVGRLNRLGYLLSIFYIITYFLMPVMLQALTRFGPDLGQVINVITLIWGTIGVIMVIPVAISVGVRRWHDLNQSGALVLLNLIPFVGFITFLIQLFAPGDNGSNKYGAPNTKPPTITKVLLGR